MSSIVGVWAPAGAPPTEDSLRAAMGTMARRGAESLSLFRDANLAMGLSLFDPSADGRHPGAARDEASGAVVFVDGLLDSVDLRGPSGPALVRDLDADPRGTLAGLRGDFALAMWSPRRGRLILARDHLGTRPLCWGRCGANVVFGSTPEALFQLGCPRAVDLQAISMVFQIGLVPAPMSGFAGVARLGQGEFLQIGPQGVQNDTFWRLKLCQDSALSEAQHIQALRQGLEDTVAEQLAGIADPLFCMSGGIDSTAVAAIGRRLLGRRVRTVCLGFPGGADDRPYARRAAEFLDTEHLEIEVTADMVDAALEEIVRVQEVPTPHSLTEFFLTREVSGRSRLLFTGETADSQFGGTFPFKMLALLREFQRIPRPLRRVLGRLARCIPASVTIGGRHPGPGLTTMDQYDRQSAIERYLSYRQIFDAGTTAGLLVGAAGGDEVVTRFLRDISDEYEGRPVDALLAFHIRHESPNEYLLDDFKSSAPVVYRSPYASQRVCAIGESIPSSLKVKGNVRKYVLVEAVRDVLPPEAITRKKMGFGLPMGAWLSGPLRHRLEEHLSAKGLPGFLDAAAVARIRDQYLAAPASQPVDRVWQLLLLSMWAKAHL